MRVIRPAALTGIERRRSILAALSMLATGTLAAELTLLGGGLPSVGTGILAAVASVGLGVGIAWLLRVMRPNRTHRAALALADLLAPVFDDSYTLVLAPRLPVRDAARLDGLLVGPGGVRVLTVRDWEGRYRVRGRLWEFHAGGRRRWVRCRTNPSFDAVSLRDGLTRWLTDIDVTNLPIHPAVAFPWSRSKVVLEEPTEEIVTTDNAPWWAHSLGRVQRMDAPTCARITSAVLDAAEEPARAKAQTVTARSS